MSQGFQMSRLQAALFYGRYNDLIYPYLSLGHMLSDMFHKILKSYGSYRLPNLEKGLTAGVIDQQGMLTPPWHQGSVSQKDLRLID
jgi:hypothetical protein